MIRETVNFVLQCFDYRPFRSRSRYPYPRRKKGIDAKLGNIIKLMLGVAASGMLLYGTGPYLVRQAKLQLVPVYHAWMAMVYPSPLPRQSVTARILDEHGVFSATEQHELMGPLDRLAQQTLGEVRLVILKDFPDYQQSERLRAAYQSQFSGQLSGLNQRGILLVSVVSSQALWAVLGPGFQPSEALHLSPLSVLPLPVIPGNSLKNTLETLPYWRVFSP